MFKKIFVVIIYIFCFKLMASETVAQVFDQFQINKDIVQQDFLEKNVLKTIVVDSSEAEIELKLYLDKSDEIYLVHKIANELFIEKSEAKYQLIKKNYTGRITATLYEAIKAEIADENLAQNIAQSFKEEFTTAKKSRIPASFSIDIEAIIENEEFVSFANVLSARVQVGRAIVDKVLMRDKDTNNLILKNVIPDESERIFSPPLEESLVSSVFNLARKHPIKRRIQPHNGIDFIARSGTKIYPTYEGEIIAFGRARARGKFVVIRHPNGFESTYDHLRKFKKGLRVGMYVSTSDDIGEVGRTGYATGAHLHFGLIKNGLFVNPIYYLTNYKLADEAEELFEEYESELE